MKLNLELSEAVASRLETLATLNGAESDVETIRRALAVYDFLWKVKAKAGRVLIEVDGRLGYELDLK